MSLNKTKQIAPAYSLSIIGGGFSGTILTVHLLRLALTEAFAPTLHVRLIEPNSKAGPGLAYGACEPWHLLNAPVNRMSAFPTEPLHFWQWLARTSTTTAVPEPTAFVPRQLYGQYLEEVLADTLNEISQSDRVQFERIESEVLAINPCTSGTGGFLELSDGQTLYTDQAVLALGGLEPQNPALDEPSFYDSPYYVRSLWQAGALDNLPQQAEVLLIGSGLSAIDGILSLQAREHQGTIHLISRRGLLPQVHEPALFAASTPPYTPFTQAYKALIQSENLSPSSIKQLYAIVKNEMAAAGNWRRVVDHLRSMLPRLWGNLPTSERGRFLRHLRPYWEIHRHRMAPQIAQVISEMQQTGQLKLHTGRVIAYTAEENGVMASCRLRYQSELLNLHVARVINCTGPGLDYTTTAHPLIRQLMATGLVQPGPLNIGLKTDQHGWLVSTKQADFLYTLGAARVGQLGETTAVAEIREQAHKLAHHLLTLVPTTVPALAGALGC